MSNLILGKFALENLYYSTLPVGTRQSTGLFLKCIRFEFLSFCKERLGEVESWHPREPTMGSAFECCEEATSPSPLLTKEGDSRTINYTFYPCECRKNQN